MEVRLAKTAGFCFGVKRAVSTVYEQIEKNKDQRIYTYGPIIHNDEVVKDLRSKGVEVIETIDELKKLDGGIVIIRSHGVSKDIYDILEDRGVTCVDATCPFVKKIHNIVRDESQAGKHIVIIGDAKHPEVQGIRGWAGENVTIIKTEDEAKDFFVKDGKNLCIVAQTTFNYNKFQYLVEIIQKRNYNISVLNTICNATKERQKEAESIAREVEAMIVIGDKHSSNSQKLFEICGNACENTYFIQTLDDLDMNQFKSVNTVGITAGASTPKNIIEEVQNNVGINF